MTQLLSKEDLKDGLSKEYLYPRKTKIVCTIGPKSQSVEKLCELLTSGMNVARMNFSHGDHPYHLTTIQNLREACKKKKMLCALLLDTKGPEVRTGKLIGDGRVELKAGQELTIVTNSDEKFRGDNSTIAMDYANLPKVVKPGSVIKIGDGLIQCTVVSTDGDHTVKVIVKNSAILGEKKGVNLPGSPVDLPAMTSRDIEDLKFGVTNGVDFIAASFTRKPQDVIEMRQVLGQEGKNIKIISKIENQQGLDNFDEILAVTDGIMVARGDLGVEIPIQKVCTAQKMMIKKCNIVGKPVITATQMLESMILNPRPTRAEAADVANAVFDGTDCVMLSGETANGLYPNEAVTVMSKICMQAEKALDHHSMFVQLLQLTKRPLSRIEAISSSAVQAAIDLEAPIIVSFTETGASARFLAKYKPPVPVLTVTHNEQTARQCLVSRALIPMISESSDEEMIFRKALSFAKEEEMIEAGQTFVFVMSKTQDMTGTTNTLKIVTAA